MINYVLYHPKGELTMLQTHDYLRLQYELEAKGYAYETKEWGGCFYQINREYVPTIRVYEDDRSVDYTVDFFNTFDKIKSGHFKGE